MAARAQALRRHGTARRLAPVLAIVAYLEARSIDDCRAVLDLLLVTELLGKDETATGKERAQPGAGPYPWRCAWCGIGARRRSRGRVLGGRAGGARAEGSTRRTRLDDAGHPASGRGRGGPGLRASRRGQATGPAVQRAWLRHDSPPWLVSCGLLSCGWMRAFTAGRAESGGRRRGRVRRRSSARGSRRSSSASSGW